jgi:hypothetical protein
MATGTLKFLHQRVLANIETRDLIFRTQDFFNSVVFLMNLTLVILIDIYHTKPYVNTNDYFIYI